MTDKKQLTKNTSSLDIILDYVEANIEEFEEYLDEFWQIEASEAELIIEEVKKDLLGAVFQELRSK